MQRYATLEDLERQNCTIEEREEYEGHLREGTVVYAGVDYERILRLAEREADILLWDGGNNDTPFYRSDLEIVVADPHRAGHELGCFPGEVNLRRAHVVVTNKVDTAVPANVSAVRQNVHLHNPKPTILETACSVSVPSTELVRAQRVLVVEDGSTLTHGEMPYGAGVVAARQCDAAEPVDPRAYAVGSIRGMYERFWHLHDLLPTVGYSAAQRHELEETINRTPSDLVLVATPVDLGRILKLNKSCVRVSYEVEELTKPALIEILAEFTHRRKPSLTELAHS